MAQTLPINLAYNSYKAQSKYLSSQRLLNVYFEPTPKEFDSPFKGTLYGTAGLSIWKDLSLNNPIYGSIVMGDNLYIVCGLAVYKIDSLQNATLIGSLTTTPARVMMTENGSQVTILTVSGRAFYTDGSTLSEITDIDYPLSDSIAILGGYTIAAKSGTNEFYISAINDTSSWNALDFEVANTSSGDITHIMAYDDELWIFKEKSIEVWRNTGNADFPFERIIGVLINERGTTSKYSVVSDESGIYLLGSDNIIYRTNGYSVQPISTDPISEEIEAYSMVSDSFAGIYTSGGKKFYALTFPSEYKTWELNLGSGLWHERDSLNDNFQSTQWRPNCFVSFNRQPLVGDFQTGIIYKIDPSVYSENGTRINREIISIIQTKNYSRGTADRFALFMDVGVGISTGQGSDPKIGLQISVNGGNSYGNQILQSVGAIGEYQAEVFWTKVAYGRSVVFKLQYSEPTKFAIQEAYLNTTEGYS